MNEDVIYRYAMAIWDRDDKESLGGKNIQVSRAWMICRHVWARALSINSTNYTYQHNTSQYPHTPTNHRTTASKQEYLEDLQKEDPVTFMPQDYVMAGRVAVLLRGLGYALKYRCVLRWIVFVFVYVFVRVESALLCVVPYLACVSNNAYVCRYSTAEAWAPLARKLLSDYGDDIPDSI